MRHAAAWLCLLAGAALAGCSAPSPLAVRSAMAEHQARTPAAPLATPGPGAARTFDLTWLTLAADLDAQRGRALWGGRAAETPAASDPTGETWLAMSDTLALQAEQARVGSARTFVPYDRRRGPAYRGDILTSFGRDLKELPFALWDDTKAVARDPTAWVLLGAAVASGAAISCSGLDGHVADHYMKHGSDLNTFWDMVGDVGGNPGLHFAVAGVMYFHGQAVGDDKEYEVAKTLLNGLAINGILTMALKGITHTDSPNGDILGWPSGHTSSTFCLATILHKAYGPWVGVPLFVFSGYVGYERIQARNHDFSDVISGALIGIAIGHVVGGNHEMKIFGMDLVPYSDPRGGVGLALTKQW